MGHMTQKRRRMTWIRGARCLVLLAGLLALGAAVAAGQPVLARAVFDGDTLALADGRHVRLAGIDCPELGRDGRPDQFYAARARQRLEELALGAPLALEPAPRPRDRFGRTLAVLRRQDGTSLNAALVREGLAFVYTVPGEWPELARELAAAQVEALDARRGFWARILTLPEAGRPWVGNARSLRAFPAGSPEARSVAAKNRVALAGLEEVFRHGFCPARHVSPWPVERGGARPAPAPRAP